MKLGISPLHFSLGHRPPWYPNPTAPPSRANCWRKPGELGVGLVQFGPNMPLDRLSEKELREIVKEAGSMED